VFRLAYGVYASRIRFNNSDSTPREESGIVAWLQSLTPERESRVLAPPSMPDRQPVEIAEPRDRSVLAAGLVNALLAGGVVDGTFSGVGLSIWAKVLLILVFASLPLLDGNVLLLLIAFSIPDNRDAHCHQCGSHATRARCG
jgi:hypothetical protein